MWTDRFERAAEAMRQNSSGLGLPKEIRAIMEHAATERSVRVRDILSRSRHPSVIAAKRDVAHSLRQGGMSYPQIGRILRMHHSGVMYYFEKHQPKPKAPVMPLKRATLSMKERIAVLEEQVRQLTALILAETPQESKSI